MDLIQSGPLLICLVPFRKTNVNQCLQVSGPTSKTSLVNRHTSELIIYRAGGNNWPEILVWALLCQTEMLTCWEIYQCVSTKAVVSGQEVR